MKTSCIDVAAADDDDDDDDDDGEICVMIFVSIDLQLPLF